MKFVIAATIATVALAEGDDWNKKARESLPEALRNMIQKDCDFKSEEELKKLTSDPKAGEAAMKK